MLLTSIYGYAEFVVLVLAYYYHGYAGLVLLTWILMSFMVFLVNFVHYTVLLVTPVITLIAMYLYVINIPGLILNNHGDIDGNEDLYLLYGKTSTPI